VAIIYRIATNVLECRLCWAVIGLKNAEFYVFVILVLTQWHALPSAFAERCGMVFQCDVGF
jgi:cytochrome b